MIYVIKYNEKYNNTIQSKSNQSKATAIIIYCISWWSVQRWCCIISTPTTSSLNVSTVNVQMKNNHLTIWVQTSTSTSHSVILLVIHYIALFGSQKSHWIIKYWSNNNWYWNFSGPSTSTSTFTIVCFYSIVNIIKIIIISFHYIS